MALTLDDLDPDQRRAVLAIAGQPIALITGGPGTGKTSCLRAALDMMDAAPVRVRYALAAPTGKAARRMSEATGRDACTLHRLLRYRPGQGFTAHLSDLDVVIVDESSMMDVELCAALMAALGARTRVVLVGDVNQLPPVGPGQPFADLIASDRVPVVRLHTLHRSAREAWISSSAPIVLAGNRPPLDDRADFRFIRVRSAASVLGAVHRVMSDVDMQAMAQVLIPMREGAAGTAGANALLQSTLNPAFRESVAAAEPCLLRDGHAIRRGDRIIHTRNNYELGVFNGEVGEVQAITADTVTVQFPEQVAEYQRSRGDDHAIELAYALTVHKSQGSEFPWVVVVVHSTHTIMLNRRLFYTAITRARQGVVLIGDDAGLDRALGTGWTKARQSTLIERIDNTADPITEAPR